MAYKSKYTGAQVEALLDKINNLDINSLLSVNKTLTEQEKAKIRESIGAVSFQELDLQDVDLETLNNNIELLKQTISSGDVDFTKIKNDIASNKSFITSHETAIISNINEILNLKNQVNVLAGVIIATTEGKFDVDFFNSLY